jgi:hypothetical protein
MAVTLPNLDRVQKVDPRLGEALQKAQNYMKLNITPVAGNRVAKPPIDPTPVRG